MMNKDKKLNLNNPSDYAQFLYELNKLIERSGLTKEEWWNRFDEINEKNYDRHIRQ